MPDYRNGSSYRHAQVDDDSVTRLIQQDPFQHLPAVQIEVLLQQVI